MLFNGKSEQAVPVSALQANTATAYSFGQQKTKVIISNFSGQTAYFKLNDDKATPVVSNTVFDFPLANSSSIIIDGIFIGLVGVYVNATSGIQIVGWRSPNT